MYAVIRRYSDASTLIDRLVERRREVEETIGDVPGLVAYYAVRTGDGLIAVTVCQSKEGADESTRRAAAWAKENVPAGSTSPSEIAEGEVIIEIGG